MTLPANLLVATQRHLDQFLTDKTCEGPHLDFKRELPAVWNDDAKRELLADATAFANSGGGDLIFGIEEDGEAQAVALVPQTLANLDQEIRRIQDILMTWAEPRLPGVQVHGIPLSGAGTDGFAVVVRIPQSWVGPHRVKTNQHFYIREGRRKRPLDVPEIRSLFLRSDSQARLVRDFRTERLGKILAGEAPHGLVDGPILVVHIVPTQAALGLVQIDPVPYSEQRRLPVIGDYPLPARLNIDGALAVRSPTAKGDTHAYSQFFRNGFFESVLVLSQFPDGGPYILPSLAYEEWLFKVLGAFRSELDRLGLNLECAVMISLLHAEEVRLGVSVEDQMRSGTHQLPFDRKTLIIPDVVAGAEQTPQQALRPAFDLMWQAAGFDRSRNFNEAGEWAPRR